jgi:hypothetical protein
MWKSRLYKAKASTFLALCLTAGICTPLLYSNIVVAQANTTQQQTDQLVIPANTRIQVRYPEAKKILVTPEETLPLTLEVAAPVRDQWGNIIIPVGSQILGQIEPAPGGSQFVARELLINPQQRVELNATSAVVSTTETINEGASTGDILKGTLAGAGAATIIAGVTGDRKIEALEVLAGAAVGTLAGWALPTAGVMGGTEKELISIDPNRDLTLTVESFD